MNITLRVYFGAIFFEFGPSPKTFVIRFVIRIDEVNTINSIILNLQLHNRNRKRPVRVKSRRGNRSFFVKT